MKVSVCVTLKAVDKTRFLLICSTNKHKVGIRTQIKDNDGKIMKFVLLFIFEDSSTNPDSSFFHWNLLGRASAIYVAENI